MRNISTGFGLCVAAATALAYPFVSSLAPNANAVGIGTTAVTAVAAAAAAQGAPTIVWYDYDGAAMWRAWSNGRVETRFGYWSAAGSSCWYLNTGACGEQSGWTVFSDPAQGLTFDADLNFDEAVDGNDLGMLLAKWGPAPRNPVPPSDCPLALINP